MFPSCVIPLLITMDEATPPKYSKNTRPCPLLIGDMLISGIRPDALLTGYKLITEPDMNAICFISKRSLTEMEVIINQLYSAPWTGHTATSSR